MDVEKLSGYAAYYFPQMLSEQNLRRIQALPLQQRRSCPGCMTCELIDLNYVLGNKNNAAPTGTTTVTCFFFSRNRSSWHQAGVAFV